MLPQHLTLLEASGLVHRVPGQPEATYIFRHALVRDAAYASLLKTDRRSLHRTVGETLASAENTHEAALTLARHFEEAGLLAQALDFYLQAAEQAAQTYASAEAIAHYSTALALAEREPPAATIWQRLYLGRGRMLELTTQHEAALADYAALRALAQVQANLPVELAAVMAAAVLRITPTVVHDLALGQPLAERALALAQQLGDYGAEVRVNWVMQLLYSYQRQPALAINYGERAVTLAREHGLKEQLAFALNDLYLPYIVLGRYAAAPQLLAEAEQLWRALGNRPMLADTLGNTASYAIGQGNFARALTLAEEVVAVSQPIGNVWGIVYGYWLMGRVLEHWGEWQRSIEVFTAAQQLADSGGLLEAQIFVRTELGMIWGVLGQFEVAWELARAASTVAREKVPTYLRRSMLCHMWLHWLQNQPEQVAALSAQYLPQNLTEGLDANPEITGQRYMLAGELALWQGAGDRGLQLATRMQERYVQAQQHAGLARALLLQGRARLLVQDWAGAETDLRRALALAEAMQARPLQTAIVWALHKTAVAAGQAAQAAHWQAQSAALLQTLAAQAPPAARATFLALPPTTYQFLYIV